VHTVINRDEGVADLQREARLPRLRHPGRVERDLIRERTAAGLAAAGARGRHGGRPSVLGGHKLQVAQEMYRSGQYTVAAIAKTLGVSRASIYRHLTGDTS
jgi:DNA invertase Pin-like site-specific DNA recombinase